MSTTLRQISKLSPSSLASMSVVKLATAVTEPLTSVSVTTSLPSSSSSSSSSSLLSATAAVAAAAAAAERTTNSLKSFSLNSLSKTDVSDMLYEFYKANSVNLPKSNKIVDNFDANRRHLIPTSSARSFNVIDIPLPPPLPPPPLSTILVAPLTSITNSWPKPTRTVANDYHMNSLSTSSLDVNRTTSSTPPPTSLSSISQNSSLPKNVNGDEMVAENLICAVTTSSIIKKLNSPFHPRIKYSNVNNKLSPSRVPSPIPFTASITSVNSLNLTSTVTSTPLIPSSVIQPPILPSTPAAAIAAALFRDGYQNLHQQMRAQELLKQTQQQKQQQQQQQLKSIQDQQSEQQQQQQQQQQQHESALISALTSKTQLYMQNIIKNVTSSSSPAHHSSSVIKDVAQFKTYKNENDNNDDGDDDRDDNDSSSIDENNENDDDNKYLEIDDIHLIEGSKSNYLNQMSSSMDTDYLSDESHKYSLMAAQAFRNLEYSFSDFGNSSPSGEEPLYECRHCGKKYRWKSTLRRHENVECGGKEPSHQCPYCPYKSKQRGNLGVHVRKHHSNLPQLASKRRSKYSQQRNSN